MFACNSAHLDRINDNIAYEFASNQNVQYVYGWDGSMDWNRITGNPQLASGQHYFYGNLVGPKRSPEGQIVYERNKSTGNILIRNVVTGRCYGLYDANGNKLVYEQSEPTAR